jgi:small-conductance mechanosensitive channel
MNFSPPARCPASWLSALAIWISLTAGTWAQLRIPGPQGVPAGAPPGNAAAKETAESKSEPAKSEPAKPDPVKSAVDSIRTWSFPEFVRWLWQHGPTIAIILVVMSGILWLASSLHGRLVRLLSIGSSRGSTLEQENRARTLVGVTLNTLRTVVIAVACIMLLEEVGIPVGPLLGGVAVAGIAVAFGAQSLVKDYFTGFLVLLEQQYIIGDMVKISGSNFNGLTGQVEQISLRVTVLRDLDGAVHFIPHGQISVVTNQTHGWSRAVFDLHIAGREQLERVRDEFCALTGQMREDQKFGPMILNDAEMLGVDAIGEQSFTVRFVLKTLPLKRWEVKRELLRRIKERFEELKIKVSVPA